ncbi:hypothetical protein VPHD148_0047 [Vibrio phage D148]
MLKMKIEFFKVKVSRLVRGTYRDLKKKFSKNHVNAADDLFGGEDVRPVREVDREKKMKSTAIVFIAGTAMGVSQVAAISSKYRVKTSPKSTIITGLFIGVLTSTVWYNYIDAASEDVSEEDIEMMFEMSRNTGFGGMDQDEFQRENGKALDILHVMVTGKYEEDDPKVSIEYEDEGDDDNKTISENNVFGKKPNLSTPSTGDSRIKPELSVGISRPLGRGRKSFLPDLDREEAEETVEEPKEGWLDLNG